MRKLVLGLPLRQLAMALVLALGLWLGSGGTPSDAMAAVAPPQLTRLQEQVEVLQKYVDRTEWFEVKSYIHGPMGLVRQDLQAIARQLPAPQQQAIQADIAAIPRLLEGIDSAAQRFSASKLQSAQKALTETVARVSAEFE
jgi:photosystem II protein PsbQ